MRPNASSRFVLFFFQAEDGIRDATVTGVQTCALPISRAREALRQSPRRADELPRALPRPSLRGERDVLARRMFLREGRERARRRAVRGSHRQVLLRQQDGRCSFEARTLPTAPRLAGPGREDVCRAQGPLSEEPGRAAASAAMKDMMRRREVTAVFGMTLFFLAAREARAQTAPSGATTPGGGSTNGTTVSPSGGGAASPGTTGATTPAPTAPAGGA